MEIQFTDREIDVMEVLWERGPSLVSEVQAALKDELAYTTVLTILRTLEGKRYVGREQEGRGHRYFAAVKQQAAQRSALHHLTSKLFKGSADRNVPVNVTIAPSLSHNILLEPIAMEHLKEVAGTIDAER
jgi:BlaI family transcriptional regulator, penicillinase repressor